MAIYLDFAKIKGGVTADGFDGQVELGSAQMGGGRNAHPNTGQAEDARGGTPYLGEVSMTKSGGSGLVGIMSAFFNKKTDKAVMTFTRDKKDGGVEAAVVWTLEDATITSVSNGGSSNSNDLSFSFGYRTLEIKEIPIKSDGSAGTPVTIKYDLKTMKTS